MQKMDEVIEGGIHKMEEEDKWMATQIGANFGFWCHAFHGKHHETQEQMSGTHEKLRCNLCEKVGYRLKENLEA